MPNLRLGRRRSKIQIDEDSVVYDQSGESSNNEYDPEKGALIEKRDTDTGLGSVHHINAKISELGVSYLRLRIIDQSWQEKVWMCVDFLQLFALLWSLSQPWPWPRPWLKLSRWVVYLNLDVVSAVDAAMAVTGPGTTSSPWGERPGYMWYGSMFSIIPVAIMGVWLRRLFLVQIWLNRGALFRRYVLEQEKALDFVVVPAMMSSLAVFERVVLRLAHVLYLPVVLAIARLAICNNDGTLSVDPEVSCINPFLVVLVVFGAGVVSVSTLHLVRNATKAAMAATVYDYAPDHERFLQRVEIEYVLQLCTVWETEHLWLVSSFCRHAVYFRVGMLFQKLALVAIYAFLRSFKMGQAFIFWGVVSGWSIWSCAYPPYRCQSSNRLHIVLQATLWTDCFFGMLAGYGARGGILVASTLCDWLVTINSMGVAAAFYVVFVDPAVQIRQRRQKRQQNCCSHDCRRRRRARRLVIPGDTDMLESAHPLHGSDGDFASDKFLGDGGDGSGDVHGSRNESGRAEEQVKGGFSGLLGDVAQINPNLWPTRATLISLAKFPRRVEWIKTLRRARAFRYAYGTCPKDFEPIRSLEALMRDVRQHWAESKAEDSVLEPPLGSALEQLFCVHAHVLQVYGGLGEGLAVRLEEILQDEKILAGMQRRRRAQILMTDRQRRLMLKLLAVSAFLNGRDFRESSTANIRRLQEETKRALCAPPIAESRGLLKTLCTQWKRLIQKSEREFEESHGKPPTIDDKQKNEAWYESYKALHRALDSLLESGSSITNRGDTTGGFQAGRHGSAIDVRRDYPESLDLMPVVSASTLTLIRATEQLLLAATKATTPGAAVLQGAVDVLEVEACRKEWKRIIKEWEQEFEEQMGNQPKLKDKQVVRSYYEYYSRLKHILDAE